MLTSHDLKTNRDWIHSVVSSYSFYIMYSAHMLESEAWRNGLLSILPDVITLKNVKSQGI